MPKPLKKRFGKKTKIILLVIAALIATVIIVDQTTPRPFVALFRGFIGSLDSVVTVGPYEKDIELATQVSQVDIPVEGLPDATLTIYAPKQPSDRPLPIIFYIHGGGWVVGTAKSVEPYAKLLASNGYLVANLEYSLAPEHPYPTPIEQSIAAINYLQLHDKDFNADATKFFIAGNSAGAQIAAQLGAVATNSEFEKKMNVDIGLAPESLKGLILFNGVYDFQTVGKDNFPGFPKFAWSYTGKKDYRTYSRIDELSTVKNATSTYPATFLTVGDADPIEAQTHQFDAVLRAQGIDVTSLYWTGSGNKLPHDYIYQLETEPAQRAYQDVLKFLKMKARE